MAHVLPHFFLLASIQAARKTTHVGHAPPNTVNDCAGHACDSLDSTEFDYIVIGSGAGGGTVAARLAKAGHSVLVLEAGVDSASKYEYQAPIQHPTSTETEGLAWSYFVNHYKSQTRASTDSKWTPKGILYPRGGTLGGSTAINALITVLPQVSDWNRMADLTNDNGWRADAMNQFEERLDEWLPKDNIPLKNLLTDIFNPELSFSALDRVLAFVRAGFEAIGNIPDFFNTLKKVELLKQLSTFLTRNINDKLRTGNVEGAYLFPQMIRDGHRHGSRERLIEALAFTESKLTIKTQALVSKIVFSNALEGGGCSGTCIAQEVLYFEGRGLYDAEINPSSSPTPEVSRVRVRKGGEIIVSAGAFNTPQILKQSGVGPRNELEGFDIPVHVDLVGVGENLQDRYEVSIETKTYKRRLLSHQWDPVPFIDPEVCNFKADENELCYKNWAQDGKGLYSINGAIFSMLVRSDVTTDSDLHIFGLPGPFQGYAPDYSKRIPLASTRNIFSWVILKGHTDNRGGTVKLRCDAMTNGKCVVNPRATPDINFNYFEDGVEYDELDPDKIDTKGENDLEGVVRAIELVRKIERLTNDHLDRREMTEETWPGVDFAVGEQFASERERLKEFVRREAWGHHASCSAPMGCIPSEEVGGHNSGAGVCVGMEPNANTVLDSRFRVRHTQGLRVVDASAFPRIPGTFLLVPTYMLAEKGAATILEDRNSR